MKPLHIGIVAGESSGDILGAGLIQALKAKYPQIRFSGIAGPKMQAAGCEAIYKSEDLAVMSLFEIIKHIPRLLKIRKNLATYFLKNRPDVFIGIDAPEFNLSLEKKLRKHGIKTIHYNSPKIWAWRSWRVKKIKKAVDLMLTLFPFEKKFYDAHNIKACFVGHPLADKIPLDPDQSQAREQLQCQNKSVLALLPGSRGQEVKYLTPIFLQTVDKLAEDIPNLLVLAPMVSAKRRAQFNEYLRAYGKSLPIQIVDDSHLAMTAADVILLASGTATLEAMLHKKPMVVAYRLQPLSYFIIRAMVSVKYIALPNLLANEAVVEEFIQAKAEPTGLAQAVLEKFKHPQHDQQIEKFTEIHHTLKKNASEKAAQAVLQLIKT